MAIAEEITHELDASSDIEETTLFQNGRSQAVRIPAKFRMKGDKVYIRQDRVTGDLILSERKNDWASVIALIDEEPFPEDFLADRDQGLPQERDLF